jgi:Universal stress protein family
VSNHTSRRRAEGWNGSTGPQRRPPPRGHVALQLAATLPKPLLVVPPQAAAPKTLNRVLVPLDAEPTTAAALAETLELACRHQLELVVLHVHDHASLPAFSDQPQHELAAWSEEFLRRHCPNPDLVRLEVRVGAPGQHVLSVAEEIGVVNTLQ